MSLSRFQCDEYAGRVRAEALRLGFSACGFARAEAVGEEARRWYSEWLASGHNHCMDYAARYRDVRDDPRLLLDGAKSIIVVALNYFPAVRQDAEAPQVAYYAYGRDYHEVVRERLRALARFVKEISGCESRPCVDTAPIREKYWAQRAGIGFVGRNNLLIIPGKGSFFFLGELVTTLEITPDEPCTLSCGECRRCEEACPGGALGGGAAVDASLCLSCQLIENRGDLPDWVEERIGNRLYGCDACQLCCPHNAHACATDVPDFAINKRLTHLSRGDVASMTAADFNTIFSHSAVRRIKLEQLQRNLSASEKHAK